MAFDRFLLLLPSSAGGYMADPDEAIEVATRLDLCGWVLGCRFDGFCSGRRRRGMRSKKRMEVTVLLTIADPDERVLATALEAAGERHMVEYRLVARASREAMAAHAAV
jgi:hypothetical protein